MKQKFLILSLMLLLVPTLKAQIHPEASIDINNIKTNLYGTGNFFRMIVQHPGFGPTYYNNYAVPADGDCSTIFSNSLWIAGLDDDNNIHCSAVRYNQVGEDFWSGPLRTTDATNDIYSVMDYHHVWKIKRSDIDAIINNTCTDIPEDILTWPAHGNVEDGYAANLAPFIDTNSDGIYNPANGDYPDILGDMALYCIFNDNYNVHTESGGEAFGLEIHCMLYGFNAPDDEKLNNTLFMRYWIHNRSSNDYNNVYVGLWNDLDIGYGYDDYVGCNVEKGYFYCYNSSDMDGIGEPGSYGLNPPAQIVMFLGGANADADDIDNPKFDENGFQIVDESINGLGYGDGVIDNERLGMCSFVYNNNSATINGDPENVEEYYNVLKGLWRNGDNIYYGGIGVEGTPGVSNIPCKFMYPDNSDPYNWGTGGVNPNTEFPWNEESANNGTPNESGDRRGLASSGPFTFESGEVNIIDKAFVTYWPSEKFDRDEMNEWADYIKDYFINNLNK